jgi:hypothetical protein
MSLHYTCTNIRISGKGWRRRNKKIHTYVKLARNFSGLCGARQQQHAENAAHLQVLAQPELAKVSGPRSVLRNLCKQCVLFTALPNFQNFVEHC